ncbi:MAG: RadC family protein [Clostridia bacterium]|nr:RadC family protein [Clostridia bacterium]
MNDSQIHVGHRERMLERFAKYPDSLNDHEILEIILYNLVPRKDTNPLAHKLIRAFGNLKNVFSASVSELMTIEGVGKKIANGIFLLGTAYSRAYSQKDTLSNKRWQTPEVIESSLRQLISGYKTEKMVMVLLNGNFQKITHLSFEDNEKSSVAMDLPELVSAMVINKPRYVIVAHNHPSGFARPSLQDDVTTKKMCVFCEVYGAIFADHLILTSNESFSYFRTGRLEYIKNEFDLLKNIQKLKNKN